MQTVFKENENIASTLHKTVVFSYGFLVVFFVGIVGILTFLTWKGSNEYPFREHISYEMGWFDADGNPVDVEKINTTKDIYKTLLASDKSNTLFISLKTGNAKVYVDDVLYYETELYETWFLGSTPGYSFVEVQIPAGESGRVLHISFDNPFGDKATNVDDILFGDGASIIAYKMKRLHSVFSLGAFIGGAGILFIVFFFLLKSKFDNANKWIYIGLFAALTGLFIMMDSKMLQLIYGHSPIWHIIIEITLMLIPIPVFLYFIEEFNLKKKIYPYIIMIISMIEILINLFLNLANIKEYHETVVFTHAVFALIMIVGMHIVGSAMIKDFKHHIYDFVALMVLALGGLIDAVLYYASSSSSTYIFLRIGIFGFLIFSGLQVISSLMNEYESAVKGDVIKRLAYHDGLTDLYNRTSFIEEMEQLDKKTGECVLLAMFDVNNLKAVNDTLGHSVGDSLILSAANALSEGFSDVGKVYRIGGDEFVVIITGDLIRDKFEKGLKKYEAKIKEMNLSQRSFSISAAVGVESNVVSETCPMQSILEKADAAMYENKKEMKRARKS